jgi:isoleucyl-tRNA synthetase
MPYAQVHYPFENKELIDNKKYFPADFIAEGVDQTRGWFFTLHAIAAMNFNSVAYKNVVSNGLVLDKNGNKMSKRLGNSVDPFETIEKYGADATRWYMIANAAPWDNLKFSWTNIYEDKNGNIVEQGSSEYENLKDKSIFKLINGRSDGIAEVQRKLFGTLYNIYGFFALYANVDKFIAADNKKNSIDDRIELDKWIDSKLQSLIQDVTLYYNEFEPHRAARAIEEFVDEHLSNWYVRLSRRRFWRAEMSADKIVAYETLFNCLTTIAQLMSPIAPFFSDWLYQSLTLKTESVHLTYLVQFQKKFQDKNLEERMELAQKISSMILSIRKKENIKVRQPLQRIQIPILDRAYQQKIEAVSDLILDEVNVKKIDFVDESQTQIVKQLKLNFKTLGKKCGQNMKLLQSYAAENGNKIISEIERNAKFIVNLNNFNIELVAEDVEIIPIDIPGWKVANNGSITVALDINISEELRNEGLARELVNRIQNLRKDSDFEVTDKILVKIQQKIELDNAIKNNLSYICSETLTTDFQIVNNLSPENSTIIEVDENLQTLIYIEKIN